MLYTSILHLDVVPIIRFSDLASHHYETLNHAIIFHICTEEIPPVITQVKTILKRIHLPLAIISKKY
ncbi:MAG: HepT-like ribonuclease domain-containing protein [Chitinophagaceae bacterium]